MTGGIDPVLETTSFCLYGEEKKPDEIIRTEHASYLNGKAKRAPISVRRSLFYDILEKGFAANESYEFWNM